MSVTSLERWSLRRRAAWIALFIAVAGWAAVVQPPPLDQPIARDGWMIA